MEDLVRFQVWKQSTCRKFFFEASVLVTVGDGRKALFWSDNWIQGTYIRSIAPNLWGVVTPRVRRTHTVRDGWTRPRCETSQEP
jgi:hypothetical protein